MTEASTSRGADVKEEPEGSSGARRTLTPALAGKAGGIALAAGTFLLPMSLSQANLTVYVQLGLYAVTAIGLSLLMGFAGQVSLGQAAFMAVGAYTAALLSLHGVPTVVALIASPAVAAAVAALVGVPILRLRGHYLAFATLAFQLILLSIISNVGFLGGGLGFTGIPPLGIGSAVLSSSLGYAWLVWAVTVAVTILALNIIRSRPGRALRALATSEAAAMSAGVPVARYKITVFALSAAAAGLAGGTYAFFIGYISPDSFPVDLSIELVVMVVILGLGSVWGALLGAAGITVLVQFLTQVGTEPGMPEYMPTLLSYAVYGVALVLIMVFLPGGILPALKRLRPLLPRRITAAPRRPGTTGPQAAQSVPSDNAAPAKDGSAPPPNR